MGVFRRNLKTFAPACQRAIFALFCLIPARAGAVEAGFPWQTRLVAETYRHTVLEVQFPSELPSAFEPNNTVWGRLYLPRRSAPGKPPCVLALPIMAAPNDWIESRFAAEYLRAGMAVLILEMPYQFRRRPHPSVPSGSVFLARTAKRLGANFRQSRADALRALRFLEASGYVDKDKIAVFGISLGAMVGSAAYSQAKLPAAGVFLLGGADFPDLVFRSDMTRAFAQAAGIQEEEIRRHWAGIDPLEYRQTNRGKPVLLVNASSDSVIPPENGRRLAEAFPDAQQVWVPLGHYGAVLHMSWMPTYAAAWLTRRLR